VNYCQIDFVPLIGVVGMVQWSFFS
jgi:hypothetical protein